MSERKRGQNKSHWDWVYEALGVEVAERFIREAHAVPISELQKVDVKRGEFPRKLKAKGASA